jgi:hypothetical protein
MDIDAFFVYQHLEDIQDDEMDKELAPGTAMAIMTLGAIQKWSSIGDTGGFVADIQGSVRPKSKGLCRPKALTSLCKGLCRSSGKWCPLPKP